MISSAAELRPFTFNYINQVITLQKVNILIKNRQSKAGRNMEAGLGDSQGWGVMVLSWRSPFAGGKWRANPNTLIVVVVFVVFLANLN